MYHRSLLRQGSSSGREGIASSFHSARATPEQTNPVKTADSARSREKPKEIIVGFSNQVFLCHPFHPIGFFQTLYALEIQRQFVITATFSPYASSQSILPHLHTLFYTSLKMITISPINAVCKNFTGSMT